MEKASNNSRECLIVKHIFGLENNGLLINYLIKYNILRDYLVQYFSLNLKSPYTLKQNWSKFSLNWEIKHVEACYKKQYFRDQ